LRAWLRARKSPSVWVMVLPVNGTRTPRKLSVSCPEADRMNGFHSC
jgi:hypothetical protein